jgi:hypothetical protein
MVPMSWSIIRANPNFFMPSMVCVRLAPRGRFDLPTPSRAGDGRRRASVTRTRSTTSDINCYGHRPSSDLWANNYVYCDSSKYRVDAKYLRYLELQILLMRDASSTKSTSEHRRTRPPKCSSESANSMPLKQAFSASLPKNVYACAWRKHNLCSIAMKRGFEQCSKPRRANRKRPRQSTTGCVS